MRIRERIEEMSDYCDVEVALVVVGGKWKLLILKYLVDGPQRFGELRRALPGITQRMLTRQLRELENDGIVSRTVHAEVPPRTEYRLTEIGDSLRALISDLDEWGKWYRGHLLSRADAPDS
ncbi:HxlR family transcriptional regulator [Saccharopolyspora erythraea NRRL 2338]|uniref:Helix-turn-helix domain-containing protein n=1 Tax=Saccharopolyspora erythraea TaxID=1836 RepID=A0ABP3LTE2_SACER|nr:HxlR family transcriptional regulator [Saccharopolyspora erythraea NRRL 2338]